MRMLQAKVKEGSLDTLRKVYEERVVPALAKVHGCRYAGLMQSMQHPEECISLTLWDTSADAREYERGEVFTALLRETRSLFLDSSESRIQLSQDLTLEYVPIPEEPLVESYPVAAVSEAPLSEEQQQKPGWVRIVSLKVRPGKKEEFKHMYVERVIPALRKVNGCRYVYLTEKADTENDVISVTSWNTKRDAEAYEASGLFGALLESMKDTLSDLYQWKMEKDKEQRNPVATSEDLTIGHYSMLVGKSYR
jgi:heme-degrading monooxygenase HmoA